MAGQGPRGGGGGRVDGGAGMGIIPEEYLGPMRQVLVPYLVAEQCFSQFFVNLDFNNPECLKYSLSKGLGLGIILGSILVKVPQIIKILRARSAQGITLISVVMELFAITSNLAYSYVSGYPFSAWGEACFLGFQTAVVAMLVLYYNSGSAMLAFSFMVGYVASVYGLVAGYTPIEYLRTMQGATIPIIVISKLIQAVSNYKNKSTGQLSAITIFMLTGGSIARIFTSIQETGDQTIVMTYMASTIVNLVIALQMLWYWNSPANGGKTKRNPTAAKKKAKKDN